MKILVTDPLSPTGIAILRNAGHEVVERLRAPINEIITIVHEFDVLLVRSGTRVTADLIARMDRMKIIGRAGAGIDNIDVHAATKRGILVMNTPGGNTRSAAEHTIGLLFAMARMIPQAHASTIAGTWDRKKWMGMEIHGKTLGVIGFGKIGEEVAIRARCLGMSVLAYDTFVSSDVITAGACVPATLEEIYAAADVITVHVPLVAATRNLISDAQFAQCKRGMHIINCARGGIIDEDALLRALESGIVSGAALDVFTIEPPPASHPLLHHERVVVTPHIGAATIEAQENVAIQIAEQVVNALAGGPIIGVVNSTSVNQLL